jgi:dihydrofolate synthase / folylpolyglutamate synthase
MAAPADSPAADIFYRFPRVIDLSLGRIQAALALLGDPQEKLPPVVHVAGTNGKGSTIAFVRAMAEAAGLRVHVYTSPHLVRIEERYRLAGTLIAPGHLERLARQVEAVAREVPLTIFEAETVAGFLAFAEVPADLVLLEVGLGGRLDATNVITCPRLTAITPVDYDHKEFLGDTIELIAAEKAGILKPGVPVVVGAQRPEALAVIGARAGALGAPMLVFGRDYDGWAQHGRFVVQTTDRLLDLPEPALAGAHQTLNAAMACQLALELELPEEAIATGLSTARWPARMQRLVRGPYAQLLEAVGGELWLDGGHNPQGAEAAARYMARLAARDARPFALVCGLLANKDQSGFFEAFAPLNPAAVVTAPVRSSPTGMEPQALAALARSQGLAATAAATPFDAVVGDRPWPPPDLGHGC